MSTPGGRNGPAVGGVHEPSADASAGDHWDTLAVGDDAQPTAEVTVGAWGTVPLELRALLGNSGGARTGS